MGIAERALENIEFEKRESARREELRAECIESCPASTLEMERVRNPTSTQYAILLILLGHSTARSIFRRYGIHVQV